MPLSFDEAYDEIVCTDNEKQEMKIDLSDKEPVLVVTISVEYMFLKKDKVVGREWSEQSEERFLLTKAPKEDKD